MPAPKRALIPVTLVIGAERITITGRAALLLTLIAGDAAHINALPVGQIIANVAHGELKLEVTEVRSVIRFVEE